MLPETEKLAHLGDPSDHVILTPSTARHIHQEYVDGVYTEISLDDFERICKGWLQFLEDPSEDVVVVLQDPVDRHPYLGKEVHERITGPIY